MRYFEFRFAIDSIAGIALCEQLLRKEKQTKQYMYISYESEDG